MDVQGQYGAVGNISHLDPTDTGAEAQNVPASLDVLGIYREEDDDK